MNSKIVRFFFDCITVTLQCSSVFLSPEIVITHFHIVSGLKRQIHRIGAFLGWTRLRSGGLRCGITGTCVFVLRRFFNSWRGFRKSWWSGPNNLPRVPTALFLVLLFVDVTKDAIDWAVGWTSRRSGLGICCCSYHNNGYRPSRLHTAILAPSAYLPKQATNLPWVGGFECYRDFSPTMA